ncbi:hypothetical protein B5X24_HaOG200995 [Helicoverpa armigera]|nr:hypothetical protein B5X24_HaOG200995 [Helicoverpa armigera]
MITKITQMVKQPITEPDSSFRVLKDDRLDKELQHIVRPINFALHLFFSSKFDVRYNHIYPIGTKYRLLTFCYTMIMIIFCIYEIFTFDNLVEAAFDYQKILVKFLHIVYFTLYVVQFLTWFVLDNVQTQNIVSFILMIQVIHRGIGCSTEFRSFVIWNWISLFSVLCVNLIIHIIYYIFLDDLSNMTTFIAFLLDILYISLDVNYAVAVSFIRLIEKYLEIWTKEVLKMNAEKENGEQRRKLLKIYHNIMDVYDLYKTIFQYLVCLK